MAKVYKKSSRNGTVSLYLGKRDFVDHVDKVEDVDGVIQVNTSALDGRRAFVSLSCTFRYGSEDLDVCGLKFRKDIWVRRQQVYPVTGEQRPANTAMQQALLKKAGEDAYAFTFTIPTNLPCSVALQPGPDFAGKACGVDFEVKAYIANEADNPDEEISRKDTTRLLIRKIQFAPDKLGAGPEAKITKKFLMSDQPIQLIASTDRELYYHGDPIPISVKIINKSNKVVRKVRITIEQTANVVLYSADKYTKVVLCEEYPDQIQPSATHEKEYQVTPLLINNKGKIGLALDGKLNGEDTNLASTSIIRSNGEKDVLGILVSYTIKVTAVTSGKIKELVGNLLNSGVTVEMPLVLMSPKPAERTSRWSSLSHQNSLSLDDQYEEIDIRRNTEIDFPDVKSCHKPSTCSVS